MYLKAIEIVGFKSFADKSRLDFEKGITCVVGPNGCGKSNIVDSVRWAIGEMSWKSLRSPSMVDIIFNGTQKRAPLNLAQVSMIFDNTSKKLPLDFNEVTVSRKIFRSGESEYFLNKVQCRLKDIRDMFLDTGIGGEGYAIIDQGGVDSVLSANGTQRREMFEEVAGVSKYKAKRDEANNRLNRVDMDIARLSDTLVLLEEQIKKLDAEAKKARLYQKYRDELKESEIAISLQSIKEFDSSIVRDMAELEPLLKRIEDLNNTISSLEGASAAMDLNLTHKQKTFHEFNERVSTAKYQIGLLEGQIKNCDNMIAELKAQLAYSNNESAVGSTRMLELEPILKKFKETLSQLNSQLEPLQAKYNEKYELVRKQEEDLKDLDIKLQRLNSELMKAMQGEMECSNKISLEESAGAMEQDNLVTLEKSGQSDNENVARLEGVIKDIQAKIAEKEASLTELKHTLSSKEQNLQSLSQNRNTLNERLSAARAEKGSLSARLDMIQTQGQNDPYWVGAKLVESSAIAGVKGTLRKNIKFAKDSEVVVEDMLGKYLDSVVCDSFETADKAIELLKSKGGARCSFIILNAVPAANGSAAKSLITFKPEFENLISYLTESYEVSGGGLKSKFWLSGGDDKVKVPEAYWGEEEDVKEQISAKEEEEKNILSEIEANNSDISKAEEEIRTLRQKFQEDSISLNTSKNEAVARQAELRNVQSTLSLLSSKKDALRQKIEEKKQRAEECRRELAVLKQQQETIKKDTEEARASRAALVTQGETLRQEANEINSALYELKIKKNNIELDEKSASYEYNTILENAKKREELIANSNARIKSLADEKLSSEAALSTQRETLASLEIEQLKMSDDINALKKEYDEKVQALNGHKKTQSELAIKARDLENALSNYRRQRTTIVNHLLESWNITPEEAAMKFEGKEVDHERVKMMRKRIENMGAVNMTAPEEYDALNERNNFLKSQIEDLNKAKADLKEAIAKINATTKENFKYTFEQVRMHFKNIYQTLFRGGEADLVLTEPENLLETGIEIYAQPPGKKLLNINALSGGEKTLTALSLLFAFFTHNPSPFCIMDEADAALDEANVERYANLIKEFSQNTQFIVVTHNKRTMEIAQMLYGITMEENGVSKLMSVNLKDKEKVAELGELVTA
ncbi:chromosome segregation protein [Parelusimicrobium proximum]|uniref:chromosome segregation protein SMC n=1 Tax=Parelusimicrobium proximum TaxID=3228953 RepID=UPI003D17CE97